MRHHSGKDPHAVALGDPGARPIPGDASGRASAALSRAPRVYGANVELWFIFFALLVAGLGLFAMFGYVRSETDKLELKHLLATEQYKRQIFELEGERDMATKKAKEAVEEAEESVEELKKKISELEDANEKLKTSLDKMRRDAHGPSDGATIRAV